MVNFFKNFDYFLSVFHFSKKMVASFILKTGKQSFSHLKFTGMVYKYLRIKKKKTIPKKLKSKYKDFRAGLPQILWFFISIYRSFQKPLGVFELRLALSLIYEYFIIKTFP